MGKTSSVAKGPIDLRSSLDKQLAAYLKKNYPGGGWSGTIYQSLLKGALASALVEHSASSSEGWPPDQAMEKVLGETQADKKGAREWIRDAGGWKAIAAEVLADLKSQNLAISGDSALIIGTYQAIKKAGATNRWKDTELNQDTAFLLARQGEETGKPPGVETGTETKESQEIFVRWLAQNSSLKGLTPVSSKGLTTPMSGLILENTLAAGTNTASRDIYSLLDEESAVSIWRNPRFNENTFRGITGHLIAEILSLGSGDLASARWAGAFLLEGAKRGWKIQSHQVTSLGRLSRNCNALPTGAPWGDLVSLFPDAVAETQIRDDLLVNPGSVRISRMLDNSQGSAWAQVAKRAAEAAEDPMWAKHIARDLERTSDWNLEGVTITDLIPLISSASSDLREAGRKLSVNVRQAKERSGVQAWSSRHTP